MKELVIRIVAAALLCGIVQRLLGEKGTIGMMGKLLSGVFLALTLISPLQSGKIHDSGSIANIYIQEGERAAENGISQSKDILYEGIKQRTEAYILDKAAGMDVVLSVEVTLNQEQIPLPQSVRLSGAVSPYAKQRLSKIMEEDLGIDKEHQVWT